MFVAMERFLSNVVEEHGQHPGLTSNDGSNWYPQACKFLILITISIFLYIRMRKAQLKKQYNV